MSGYRQSRFDPNAHEQPGPPLRPYNMVQWSGVAIGAVGIVLVALDVLGRIGWIPRWTGELSAAPVMLLVIASFLVNSRRGPAVQAGSEQLARNRRILLITIAFCAAVIGAALVIDFTGA